ncbi:uncharacterized protein LOC127877871 isoform X2 [Dreissena polymorpha]|uniref:C2H2-type domain-containing protein n=2 Tax=Dreissena polymorpha TaxID=45954 RepID=A0A9D4HCJ3_DREPO|nr:uncharacterized protein LOC127877871 isoform X2 [Dreissena polymorpha]KAH3831735.1 hypothetical protein DPMN_105004 [Dreissena polymorpha]
MEPRPLLESIGSIFQQNQASQDEKVARFKTQREAELAHAAYITHTVADPGQLARAQYIAGHYAKKNGMSGTHFRGVRAVPANPNIDLMSAGSLSTSNRNNFTGDQLSEAQNKTTLHNRAQMQREQLLNRAEIRRKKVISKKDHIQSSDVVIIDSSLDESAILNTSLSNSFNNFQTQSVEIKASSQNCSLDDPLSTFKSGVKDASANRPPVETQSGSHSTSSPNNPTGDQSKPRRNRSKITRGPPNPTVDQSSEVGKNKKKTRSRWSCRILNCEATFSDEIILAHHMNLFQHSPCNPCIRTLDCKLLPDPLGYVCPECDKNFADLISCKNHINKKPGHLGIFPPLEVAAYMCAQCLQLFSTRDECTSHLEESKHSTISYPFTEDCYVQSSPLEPIPVFAPLVVDFMARCSKKPYSVQCLECGLLMETPACYRNHMLETQNQHVVSAFTEANVVDTFAEYLASYSCTSCHRLLDSNTDGKKRHECGNGVHGEIVENDTRSFKEFLRRCALTLVRPVNVDPDPGPSGVVSGVKRKRSQVLVGSQEGSSPESERAGVQKSRLKLVLSDSDDDCVVVDTPQKTGACRVLNEMSVKSGQKITVADECRDKDETEKSEKCNKATYTFKLDQIKFNQIPGVSRLGEGFKAIFGQNQNTENENIKKKSKQDSNNSLLIKNDEIEEAKKDFSFLQTREFTPPDFMLPGSSQTAASTRSLRSSDPKAGSSNSQEADSQLSKRDRSRSPIDDSPVSTPNLSRMRHLIFLDLDNFGCFFTRLPRPLPDGTFVWAFQGGKVAWFEPHKCALLQDMKQRREFYLHQRCGTTKDAADFAIVLTVGKMHERLPKEIPFTIVSGDKGFLEVERQMKTEQRRAIVVDPHAALKESPEMMYILMNSIIDV